MSWAALEFSGYLKIANEAKFMITDTEGKKSSGWIAIGAWFGDYSVASFDAEKETLTLRKGAATVELPLKQAHAKNMTLPPEIARRGITAEDLFVRQDEKARINLGLGRETAPVRKRYVSVELKIGQHEYFGRDFDGTSPPQLTRAMLPEFAQAVLSDADIENINRHVAIVLPRWLPEDQPTQIPEPTPGAVH